MSFLVVKYDLCKVETINPNFLGVLVNLATSVLSKNAIKGVTGEDFLTNSDNLGPYSQLFIQTERNNLLLGIDICPEIRKGISDEMRVNDLTRRKMGRIGLNVKVMENQVDGVLKTTATLDRSSFTKI